MTCREEVLDAARTVVSRKRKNEFGMIDIIMELRSRGTSYEESTIRTHVSSRCCANAPKNHETTYDDFERIGRGRYRIRRVRS